MSDIALLPAQHINTSALRARDIQQPHRPVYLLHMSLGLLLRRKCVRLWVLPLSRGESINILTSSSLQVDHCLTFPFDVSYEFMVRQLRLRCFKSMTRASMLTMFMFNSRNRQVHLLSVFSCRCIKFDPKPVQVAWSFDTLRTMLCDSLLQHATTWWKGWMAHALNNALVCFRNSCYCTLKSIIRVSLLSELCTN